MYLSCGLVQSVNTSRSRRHKVLWKAREELARGHCIRAKCIATFPCLYDYPSVYVLSSSNLKISQRDRGCCCGLCVFDQERKANNIMLKNVVDVDSEAINLCCGTEYSVTVSAQEGIDEGE